MHPPSTTFPEVAGWDLPFDVAADDVELARDCFRILRRTCARFYVDFTYYQDRRRDTRVEYILVFDGRPHMLGVASTDFTLEMRAVSMLQRHPRRKRLPLRLAHWITYSGSDYDLQEQADEAAVVPPEMRARVLTHLVEYALAWDAWLRGTMPSPEYLEAQHSLLTSLALDLGEGVNTSTRFPQLIKVLQLPAHLEAECLDLGNKRNRVKHRGFRSEAEAYASENLQCVHSVILTTTGIDLMPRSDHMLRWEKSGRLPQLAMYDRQGQRKRFTRY